MTIDRQSSRGFVSLVGAGPGDPGLLTIAGHRRLAAADCVIYDKLVDRRLLDWAPPTAERLYVGKTAAAHCVRQAEINELIIDRARQGKRVVRLKGGDALLFARGAEEAEALVAAGIAFEIVPGVTAALACAATAAIPLTHRTLASAVAFLTGHEDPDKADSTLDWSALARFPGTLAVYMGLSKIGSIAQSLITHGLCEQTPLALVEAGGTNRQRVEVLTVGEVVDGPPAGLVSPVLALIGPTVALRPRLAWHERRPLAGQTILLPRPAAQAETTAQELHDLGANVLVEPAVTLAPPDHWEPVDAVIDRLADFDWLIFTSANGVRAFLGRCWERWKARGGDVRQLAGRRLIAIGPRTADTLHEFQLRADLVRADGKYRSEDLLAVLAPEAPGRRVLLARADRGVDVLPAGLQAAGATVEQVTVYVQRDVPAPSPATLDAFRQGQVQWGLLTSSNIAENVLRWLREASIDPAACGTRWVTISATTSGVLHRAHVPVAAEAADNTLAGMIACVMASPEAQAQGPVVG